MIKVDAIQNKINELNKEKGRVKRSYYNKHIFYGLSIPFFLVTGALSIVASPFAAISWVTIGAGLANAYRKHLNSRKAKVIGIENELKGIKAIRRIDVSDGKRNERNTKIVALKGQETNHKIAIDRTAKKRKIANRLFVGSTVAGLFLPVPFAIVAPIILAYKISKDSDAIKHSNKMELLKRKIDYYEAEQKIADRTKEIRNKQSTQPQQQNQQTNQQQQTRQTASSTPTISRDEQMINEYIELLTKKPEELHKEKTLIKK